jgi:hypothetical protein
MVMHDSANYITPDTAAECLGIPARSALYAALWGLVEHYQKINYEECGPADVVGINSIAKFWHMLPEDLQVELNFWLELEEAELESW